MLDINECVSSPCPNTMKCENTLGSYKCVEGCDTGYTWSIKYAECRGTLCLFLIEINSSLMSLDNDECATNSHNCTLGHRCENMPGSYR